MIRNLATRLYLRLRGTALFRPAVLGRVFEGIAVGVLANTLGYVFDGALTRGRVLALLLALVLLFVGANLEDDRDGDPP